MNSCKYWIFILNKWLFVFLFSVENVTKSIELTLEGKGKTGEITLALDGMNVNMTKFPKKNQSRHSQAQANGTYLYMRSVN